MELAQKMAASKYRYPDDKQAAGDDDDETP